MSAGALMGSSARRRLRPLFVFEGLYPRGAERVSLALAGQLDRARFDPRLWILRSVDGLDAEMPPDARARPVLNSQERIRHALAKVPGSLLRAAQQADVIVATVEIMPTYLAALAGLLTGTPVVGWVRNSMDQTFADHPNWHLGLSRLIYPRLPRLVFVSHGAQQTLQGLMPLREERLSVIHNPLNPLHLEAQAAAPLPEWAGFMEERPVVLGAGRLTRQKGFDLLIQAHARLRAQGLRHDLLILGEGEARPELRALAERLGVEESVHLPGHVVNPYPFMRRAAAFALSSRYEGFANVVTEALACGAPVVATDCPSGPAEILTGRAGERPGLLVPVNDPGALAAGLATVLTDEALARRLRDLGRARALDFAPERVVPRWEAVLQDTARPRRPFAFA